MAPLAAASPALCTRSKLLALRRDERPLAAEKVMMGNWEMWKARAGLYFDKGGRMSYLREWMDCHYKGYKK